MQTLRNHLYTPIPELFAAAKLLHQAALAHVAGDRETAAALIAQTDSDPSLTDSPIFDWSEILFAGRNLSFGKIVCPTIRAEIFDLSPDPGKPQPLPAEQRDPGKVPNGIEKEVIARDGYFCRYCNVPVIHPKAQSVLRKAYPHEYRWGDVRGEAKASPRNIEKHVVFQALDLDIDHVVPRSYGGRNTLENLIVSCAPCNNGKQSYTLAEIRLSDPRDREPLMPEGFEHWDGLTLILK